jgi:hypothetical protein
VSKIPSINLGLGEVDRSANFCKEKEQGMLLDNLNTDARKINNTIKTRI